MEKDTFRDVFEKVWPNTKKELEKAVANTKKILQKGETYLREVSEKSANNTKILSLNLKKEKLYYTVGKHISRLSKGQWPKDVKLSLLIKEIRAIDRMIRKIS